MLPWIGFTAAVLAILAIDLGLFHRKAHEVSIKEAAAWVSVWVSLAILFNIGVWYVRGGETALMFTTGYVIELALSVDNLFVFLVIFASLAVPKDQLHRVLFWGIMGALVTRGLFIAAGAALIARFDWIFWVFGGFLVLTGLKLLMQREVEPHPERNIMVRLFRRFFPVTPDYVGSRFFVKRDGKRFATPLFVVLITVEATDVVFAVDSIPAIFAITTDPFIVYTSNVFAILGLRSMFFLLAGMMDRFHYLKVGLALVLVFVGGKMLAMEWFHVPIGWSLAVVGVLLGGSMVASLLRPRAEVPPGPAGPGTPPAPPGPPPPPR